jgi:hypothetical protein
MPKRKSRPDIRTTIVDHLPGLDPWEFQHFQQELQEWTFIEVHHMHKSWQFATCQQAMRWYALAQEITELHGKDCYFFLGHVGSGRIETDIINHIHGHLTRDDLNVAMMLNSIKIEPNQNRESAKDRTRDKLPLPPPQACSPIQPGSLSKSSNTVD